jgi:hypothetical protein
MFEILNLKSAITFRVVIQDKVCSFTTNVFRGKNVGRGNIPDPKDHVPYDVYDILLDSSSTSSPWYTLDKPATITVLWSNVKSVQLEKL